MASVNQFLQAAQAAGFVRTTCPHKEADRHIVRDYPAALVDGQTTPHWRVHVDISGPVNVTYIVGSDTPQQRVSLKNAINFMRRVTLDHPKE